MSDQGNTIGRLQGAVAKSTASAVAANSAASAEAVAETSWWSAASGWVHGGLDALGAIPELGAVFDGANAIVYTAEGDLSQATISGGAAALDLVPGVGTVGKVTEFGVKGAAKLAAREAAELDAKGVAKQETKQLTRLEAKQVVEQEAKQAEHAAEKEATEGAKVLGPKKLPKQKVPCFHPYNKTGFKGLSSSEQRSYLREYAKQLRGQEEAINRLTANEFTAARDAYSAVGRNPVANEMQEAFRDRFAGQLRRSIFRGLVQNGTQAAQALPLAIEKTGILMDKMAALHEPDMVAGGWANPNPTKMGDTGINSSIGASWNQKGRLDSIEKVAKNAITNGKGDAPLNVKLELCRGKGIR